MSRRHHSLRWRVSKAIEQVTARRPVMQRTGPAWAFGIMGLVAEAVLAPVVLGITLLVGLGTYVLLDAPWTKVRAQQRPRFVSVRILYLNTLIVTGFWLAVMFVFTAADPDVSTGVEQRLPQLLDVATTRDLSALVSLKRSALIRPETELVGAASTWFDVFLHGVVCALALNFVLYGIVIARRRYRLHHRGPRTGLRRSLRYDSTAGLFVDGDATPPG